MLAREAGGLGVREFRQLPAHVLDEGVFEHDRQQVRIREVAIVVRFLLAPHRARLVAAGVVEPRLLH